MRNRASRQVAWWCRAVVAAAVVLPSDAVGGDLQQWEVSGKFLSLKEGQVGVAVFEVVGAVRVEIPLAALSESNRGVIAEWTKSQSPPSEATDSADKGGATAGDDKASSMVTHAIDLLRLGNPQLAKQELQKASKADRASSEADFVMAIVYAVGAKNYEKAVEHFAEVVSREPAHVAGLANLALCELHTKQYSSAVGHFRRALELKPDGQAIADNMALAIQATGAGRARMNEKVLADLSELYRKALVDLKLSRLDPGASRALVFHGLDGRPVDPLSPTLLLDAVKRPQPPAPQEPVERKLDEPPANQDKDPDAVPPQSQ